MSTNRPPSAPEFTIKQGDTRPFLRRKLLNADGSPVQLPDTTTVKFKLFNCEAPGDENYGQPTIDTLGHVVDHDNGIVEYRWISTDTVNAGSFLGEFEVDFGNGVRVTVPNDGYIFVRIQPQLG